MFQNLESAPMKSVEFWENAFDTVRSFIVSRFSYVISCFVPLTCLNKREAFVLNSPVIVYLRYAKILAPKAFYAILNGKKFRCLSLVSRKYEDLPSGWIDAVIGVSDGLKTSKKAGIFPQIDARWGWRRMHTVNQRKKLTSK